MAGAASLNFRIRIFFKFGVVIRTFTISVAANTLLY